MNVTLSLFAGAGAQFFDNNGIPLSGGKIYTYAAGTTTPLATYTTASDSAFHTNPIILDSSGRVPSGGEIWLNLGQGYKFLLKTSADVLIATYDNIPSSAQPPASNDANSIMYEQGYTVTAGSFVVGSVYQIYSVGTTDFTLIGASSNTSGVYFTATGVGSGTGTAKLSQTVEKKLQQTISVLDFGADPTGAVSSVAAFQSAINSVNTSKIQMIHVPRGTYLGNMDTLTYGTGIVIFEEEGGVTYSTAAPSGEFCVRRNTTISGDNTRPWIYGFNGIQYNYLTGTNRPLLRIQKSNNAVTTAAGNASALSILNQVNNNSGQLSNGAIENCLVMQTDVYTNATTAATPAFGLIQGTLFKYNPSYGSFISSNFVARDQTKLGTANSFGSLVAMELDVVASGPDTGTARIGLDVVGRGYDVSVDGATSMYAGIRVRPASAGVLSSEPMAINYAYKTEIGALGSIDTHFFADGPCKSTGYHFQAVSDSTIQGKARIASQRNTAAQTVAQIELSGWNSSSVLKSYSSISSIIGNATAGSEAGIFQIDTFVAGTSTTQVQVRNGVVVGTATGSGLGNGTINVSGGVYLNGTAYTNPDYVFEKAYTGKIEKFVNKLGADTYVTRTIEEFEEYTKDNLALPGFGQDANLDYLSGAEMLLARLEEAYLMIFELNKRIKALEAK